MHTGWLPAAMGVSVKIRANLKDKHGRESAAPSDSWAEESWAEGKA